MANINAYTNPAQNKAYNDAIAAGKSPAEAVEAAQAVASTYTYTYQGPTEVVGDTPLKEGSILRYPYEALTENTDYFRVIIKEKQNSGQLVESSKTYTNTVKQTYTPNKITLAKETLAPGGMIILPIPSNVNDNNSVSYNAGSMNNMTKAMLQGSMELMGEGFGALDPNKSKEIIERAGTSTGLTAGVAKNLVQSQLAAQAANVFGSNVSISQLLARSGNKIFNPNMELLFDGVKLRSFNFQFKMTPRDKAESDQVKYIIRSLKQNMAPKMVQDGSLFIKTPNVFELSYMRGSGIHPFLNSFKQCALTDMKVNYTAENVYAVYDDSTPISMILDLSFQELVPVYAEDYSNTPLGVGY